MNFKIIKANRNVHALVLVVQDKKKNIQIHIPLICP